MIFRSVLSLWVPVLHSYKVYFWCLVLFCDEGLNRDGFDKDGYNVDGYNRYGYNKEGYNPWGFNRTGYDKAGKKDTQGIYDQNGFDDQCLDIQGMLVV